MQQSFFKPISNTDGVKLRCSNGQRQTNSLKINEQATGAERLSSLHLQLHQEADKIRKWKDQTEIEIKQKEKNLLEANQTIDHLRKSIVDLQIQNESLSMKLQDEILKHEEIAERVTSTREICNLLKEHCERTGSHLEKCEEEKVELKSKEQENAKLFEELSQKFKDMHLMVEEEHFTIKNKLENEIEAKTKLQQESSVKIEEFENQLRCLEEKCADKEKVLDQLHESLLKNEEKRLNMESDLTQMLEQHKNDENTIREDQAQLNALQDDLARCKRLNADIECTLASLCKKIQCCMPELDENSLVADQEKASATELLEGKLHHLISYIEKCKLSEEKACLENKQLQKMCKDLECTRDNLVMEKTEFENKIQELDNLVKSLESKEKEYVTRCGTLEENVEKFTMDIEDKVQILKNTDEKLKSLMQDVEKLTEEKNMLKESRDTLQENLNALKFDLEKECECSKEKSAEVANLSHAAKDKEALLQQEREQSIKILGDLSIKEEQLASAYQEIEKQRLQYEELFEDNSKKIDELKKLQHENKQFLQREKEMGKNVAELESELEEQKKRNEDLLGEKEEQDKNMSGELLSKSKEKDSLEEKIKAMKETLSGKTKQIKELEKELRSQKSKNSAQVKDAEKKDKEIEHLREQLVLIEEEKKALHLELENANATIENEKTQACLANNQAKDLQQSTFQALKEKDECIRECEHQISQMTATLEKYHQDNNKMVSLKDREVEYLKEQLEQIQSLNCSSKEMTNKEVLELKEQLGKKCDEMTKLEEIKLSTENKQKDLKKKIKSLKEEVANQKKEIEKYMKKEENYASLATQTESLELSGFQPSYKSPLPWKPEIFSTPKSNSVKTYSKEQKSTPNYQKETKSTTPISTPHQQKMPQTPSTTVKTPKLVAKTPQGCIVLKTPQRGILKQSNLNSAKRRKVAFASDEDEVDTSDSESSHAMELSEVEETFAKQKKTPVVGKPSPRIRMNMKNEENKDPLNKIKVVSKPARGKSSLKLDKKKTVKDNQEDTIDEFSSEKNGAHGMNKSANIRKTPHKNPGKFFTTSPKERAQKKKGKEDQSWFDIDSVFGFGAED